MYWLLKDSATLNSEGNDFTAFEILIISLSLTLFMSEKICTFSLAKEWKKENNRDMNKWKDRNDQNRNRH